MNLLETMDDENYPTDETLRRVREYEGDVSELMAEIRKVWAYADWGWHEEDASDIRDKPVRRYSISTAGWSGNESIIDALENCGMFWMFFWVQSRRGGHYIFEVSPNMTKVLQFKPKEEPLAHEKSPA